MSSFLPLAIRLRPSPALSRTHFWPSTSRSLFVSSISRNAHSSSTTEEQQDATPKTAGERKIAEILTQRFSPSVLKVQDVSGGCGSFYAIQLSSKEFKGVPTVKAHRMVNQELKDVIKDIHGLQLRTVAED